MNIVQKLRTTKCKALAACLALTFACSHMADRPKHVSQVKQLLGLDQSQVHMSLGQPQESLRSSKPVEIYFLNDEGPNNPAPTPVRYKLIYNAQNKLVGFEKDK